MQPGNLSPPARLAPAAVRPAIDLWVESEGDAAQLPRFAAELADALGHGGDASIRVRPLNRMTSLQASKDGTLPALAVLRYDVMMAAAARSATPLSILAPLYIDQITVVVRASSALHQRRGGRQRARCHGCPFVRDPVQPCTAC